MDSVKDMLLLLISSSIVSNIVLSQFMGLCPFLGVSRKIKTAGGMGTAVIFVITLASAVAGVIYKFIVQPLHIEYLETIVFILVIAALVQFVEMFLKKAMPSLYQALGVYLPLITTNCTILGVTILNIDNGYNFIESIVCAAGAGIGFLVAMVLFSGVRRRVEQAVTPACFKGLPITLVAAAMTSLSFMGFGGIVEAIFRV